MSGKKSSQDYGAVANANPLSKKEIENIFCQLRRAQNKEKIQKDFYTKNDLACLIYMWCNQKGIQLCELKTIIANGKKHHLYKNAMKDLPFLFSPTFSGNTKKQKEVIKAWNRSERTDLPTKQELRDNGFPPRKIEEFEKYVENVANARKLPLNVDISSVLIAATTKTSKDNSEIINKLKTIDCKDEILLFIKNCLESNSFLIRKHAKEAFKKLIEAPEHDFSCQNAWGQLQKIHKLRPTTVQLQILDFLTGLSIGKYDTAVGWIEGLCGSGKTFGLVIAMRYILDELVKHQKGKMPIVLYSHKNRFVRDTFEQNCAEFMLPMIFISSSCMLIQGVMNEVVIVKFCHETLGRYTLTFKFNEDSNTWTQIQVGEGSKMKKQVSPLLQIFKTITDGKVKNLVSELMPCIISLRDDKLRSSVMSWQDIIYDELSKCESVIATGTAGDEMQKAMSSERIISRYLRMHTGLVIIEDDFGYNKDSPDVLELYFKKQHPLLAISATLPKKIFDLMKKKRNMIEYPKNSDTVGKGFTLVEVPKDEEIEHKQRTASDKIFKLDYKKILEKSGFFQTTLSMDQVYIIITSILTSLQLRNIIIDVTINNKGLNEIRKLLLDLIQKEGPSVDFPCLKIPICIKDKKFIEFFNSEAHILSTLQDYDGDPCKDLKELCKAHQIHLLTLEEAKKNIASRKKAKRVDNKTSIEQDSQYIDKASLFEHGLIGRHNSSGNVIMELVYIGMQKGVSDHQIMLYVKNSIIIVCKNTPPEWWGGGIRDACIKKILSDNTLAYGVNLPDLDGVCIHRADASPREIIQMAGRVGRPHLPSGIVSITDKQLATLITHDLDDDVYDHLMKTKPRLGISNGALSKFDSATRTKMVKALKKAARKGSS